MTLRTLEKYFFEKKKNNKTKKEKKIVYDDVYNDLRFVSNEQHVDVKVDFFVNK